MTLLKTTKVQIACSIDKPVMVPFQMLVMVGHNVHTVCPNKKKDEKIKTAVHDFEGDQTYTEKPGIV